MIVNNSFNRGILRKYLESVSEDTFIDEVVVPLFSKNGYLLFRRNSHGPGEHGKDLIFYRHVKLFYDNEYIVVQAKADPVTASNVTKYANQLVRALKVPFPGGKGRSEIHANYVYFINSRLHTNDVNFEFQYLADMKDNIKIIGGDRTVELMIEFDIIPEKLTDEIEQYEEVTSEPFDKYVRDIILGGNNNDINKLLDYDLTINTIPLSDGTKALVINYIFHKWREDPTWKGIVKPMKWLRQYFHFIQPGQYKYLIRAINEYISTTPSFGAEADTNAVMELITPEQISTFQSEFIDKVVNEVMDGKAGKHPLIIAKFNSLIQAGLLAPELTGIKDSISRFIEIKKQLSSIQGDEEKQNLKSELKYLRNELFYFLYPNERE